MPAATGQATIQWNQYPQLRLGLCILYEDYPHTDGPQKVKIFSKVFAVELATCDFPSGVPDEDYEKVCVQWRDRRKEGNAHIWRDITTSPTTEAKQAEVKVLKKTIKEAATELGLGGGLADLPVYDGSKGVGSVARRGVRVAVKAQDGGSGSDRGSSAGESGDESGEYRGLGSGPPRAL